LPTEIDVGIEEGLKHDSAIRCDELISIQKYKLTNFIATLSKEKIQKLDQALKIALEIDD
jgi:mRNA interferase MazF